MSRLRLCPGWIDARVASIKRLPTRPPRTVVQISWWRLVAGADRHYMDGPHSDIRDCLDHPAMHVSWPDAVRGGLSAKCFPSGDQRSTTAQHRLDVWQGCLPAHQAGEDSCLGTVPVTAFAPNGHSLSTMIDNGWEGCADSHRYWVAARSANLPACTTGNLGFRRAGDAD